MGKRKKMMYPGCLNMPYHCPCPRCSPCPYSVSSARRDAALENGKKVLNNPNLTHAQFYLLCQEEERQDIIYLQDLKIEQIIEDDIFELLQQLLSEKDEEEKGKEMKQEWVQTCDWIKNRLGDKVDNVLISNRHGSSSSSSPPCVLVSRRVLEINPDHPIVMNLNAACKSNPDDVEVLRAIDLLYDAALLSSGFTPKNPAQLGGKIYEMMDMALCGKWSSNHNQLQLP